MNVTSATDRANAAISRRAATIGSRLTPGFLRRIGRRYIDSGASTWATSISWNAMASFVPLVLILVGLLGLFYGIDPGFARAVELRVARLGSNVSGRAEIHSTLTAFRDHTSLFAGIGVVWLLWSGSGLFAAMDNALSAVYGEPARPYLRKRIRALGVTVVFALLLTPLVLSAALLTEGRRFSLIPQHTPQALLYLAQFAAGALMGMVIYAVIYQLLPNRRQRLRRVVRGAAVAGTLLEVVTLLFPLWLHLFDSAASYGVLFSAIVLLITYFYLVGQITVVGALINVERDPVVRAREAGSDVSPGRQGSWSSPLGS